VTDTFVHLDEDGRPCANHPPAMRDAMFALAMMGARASSFHHDIASKLQGIMMALDEISELGEQNPDADLRRATDTAQTALKELNQLLNANRALAKPPSRTRQELRALVAAAARAIDVTTEVTDGRLVLGLVASRPSPDNAGESLAIAAWILGRDGGDLRCTPAGDRLVLQLPIAS